MRLQVWHNAGPVAICPWCCTCPRLRPGPSIQSQSARKKYRKGKPQKQGRLEADLPPAGMLSHPSPPSSLTLLPSPHSGHQSFTQVLPAHIELKRMWQLIYGLLLSRQKLTLFTGSNNQSIHPMDTSYKQTLLLYTPPAKTMLLLDHQSWILRMSWLEFLWDAQVDCAVSLDSACAMLLPVAPCASNLTNPLMTLKGTSISSSKAKWIRGVKRQPHLGFCLSPQGYPSPCTPLVFPSLLPRLAHSALLLS